MTAEERKKRANGIASRNAILDAAAEIAGERGYEGTGIKAVSERSGLPASSIYWHFTNKDELIAAVIDRSFTAWVEAQQGTDIGDAGSREAFVQAFRQSALELARFPDFVRLGLMLMLEQRPDEPTARRRFKETRVQTLEWIRGGYRRAFPDLGDVDVRRLATLTLAASDGLFVADQAGEAEIVEGFETLALAIHGAVAELRRG